EIKATGIPSSDNRGVLWNLESKRPGSYIMVELPARKDVTEYKSPYLITATGNYNAVLMSGNDRTVLSTIRQSFSLNKATGKKITLTTPADNKYRCDGAFTLVNGVINDKGFAKSTEFLGFNGSDCEAIIDLGTEKQVSFV